MQKKKNLKLITFSQKDLDSLSILLVYCTLSCKIDLYKISSLSPENGDIPKSSIFNPNINLRILTGNHFVNQDTITPPVDRKCIEFAFYNFWSKVLRSSTKCCTPEIVFFNLPFRNFGQELYLFTLLVE